MSTATSATESSSATVAGKSSQGHASGQSAPSGMFSNLLSLLSATHEDADALLGSPADASSADDTGQSTLSSLDGDDVQPLPMGSPTDIAAAMMSGWPMQSELPATRSSVSHGLATSDANLSGSFSNKADKDVTLDGDTSKLSLQQTETGAAQTPSSRAGIDIRNLGMQPLGAGQRIELQLQNSAAAATANTSGTAASTNSMAITEAGAGGAEVSAAISESNAQPGSAAQQRRTAKLKAHAPANTQATVTTQNWRSTTSLTPATSAVMSGRTDGFVSRSTDLPPRDLGTLEAGTAAADAELTSGPVASSAEAQTGGQSHSRQGEQRGASLPDHLASQMPDNTSEGPESDSVRTEQSLPDANEQQAAEEANGELSPELGRWGANQIRHATLRVGDSASDAIDIQLRMNGQEAQVEFRTDNAEARASLEQNAGQSLHDMLGRSGIQLSDVSVNSQHQDGSPASHQGPGNSGTPGQGTDGRATNGSGPEEEMATNAAQRPVQRRSDGSEPLDLFV